jgi:deoxyhypusine synthase
LVDTYFQAFNAARLRETCQIFTQKVLAKNVTVGMVLQER